MILFYLLGLFILINLICVIVNAFHKDTAGIVLSLLCMLICSFCLVLNIIEIPSEKDIEEKIQYYMELKERVEVVKLSNDNNLDIFKSDLQKEVFKMNEEIQKNKNNYKSQFNGAKYSEEIGNLEEIQLW